MLTKLYYSFLVLKMKKKADLCHAVIYARLNINIVIPDLIKGWDT